MQNLQNFQHAKLKETTLVEDAEHRECSSGRSKGECYLSSITETLNDVFLGFLQCMLHWDSKHVHFETLTLPAGCWRYRGEGNANIVIALKNEPTIIRLSKNNKGVSWNDHHLRKVERQVVFTSQVFAPLLGKNFVAHVWAVYVSPEQINQLNDCLQKIRPRHRMHKELKVPYASAHSDFARTLKLSPEGVDYCVEIKPKKGWWVKSSIPGDVRPSLCTYCLNQYQKLKKCKIISRSNYCPLDLFSGYPNAFEADPARIVRAVISLLASPQNNLRIFRNGCLVYSSENSRNNTPNALEAVINDWMSTNSRHAPGSTHFTGRLRNFIYLICLALMKPHVEFPEDERGMKRYFQLRDELEELLVTGCSVEQERNLIADKLGQNLSRSSCILESADLPAGCVLSRILRAQKLEDADNKYIRKLFKIICPVHTDLQRGKSNLVEEECPSSKCLAVESWLDEIPTENLLPKELACIQRHLLAATVKDCSIMMSFSSISPMRQDWATKDIGNSVIQDLQGEFHVARVGIVDLDPKPISAVVKHHVREADMVKAYYAADE